MSKTEEKVRACHNQVLSARYGSFTMRTTIPAVCTIAALIPSPRLPAVDIS
jgi:hypothetical protein